VNQNCEAEITADMILENSLACPGPKFLEIRTLSGDLVVSGVEPVTVPQVFLGQTLGATVVDVDSGDQCTGYIRLIDELEPTFLGCPDVTMTCTEDSSPIYTGYPDVMDNCDQNVTITYVQSQTAPDCSTLSPYFSIITRIWTATDDFNNQNTCTQKIYLLNPTMQDLLFPGTLTQSCSNSATHPDITGWPTINGNPITGDDCCFSVLWSDQIIPTCGNSYQIARTWVVVLSSTEVQTAVQVIYVTDTLPPDISCQPLITIISENNPCTASFSLPEPAASDNCSAPEDLILSVNTSFGGNGTGPYFDIPVGSYTVTYTAQDECGNIGTCQTALHIECQPLVDLCPTLVLQPDAAQGKDAPVTSYAPGNNYAANGQLTAHKWTIGGVWYTTRSYLDFDWSALPANASIISAELDLTGATGTFNQYLYPCLQGPNDLYLTLVSDPWDESTITWNNKPGTSSDPLHQVNVPAICTPGGNLSADVTQLVQTIVSGTGTFHGFELRLQQEAQNQYRAYSAYSSDHTDPAARPRMTIQYSLVWYADLDGDGFGDPNDALAACAQPAGYVADNTDCDDTDPDVFPGVMVISCPASVPPLLAVSNCQSTLEDYTGLASVSGTCSLPLGPIVQTPPPGTLVSDYATPVTLSVTNAAGQSASCTFTVIKQGCGNFPWDGD
jgi:hypothetical protein